MAQSYRLSQTYAPTEEFDQYMAALQIDMDQFCYGIGIHPSTLERIQRLRTTSRKTAQRVSYGFAIIHGAIQPQQAFTLLFTPRAPKFMDLCAISNVFRRRRDE